MIFIDLDNTLYNQEQILRYAFGKISEELKKEFNLNKSKTFRYLLNLVKKKTLRYKIFDDLVSKFNLEISSEELVKLYREFNLEFLKNKKIELYKSALDVLNNDNLTVYTEGNREIQEEKIKNIMKNYGVRFNYIIVRDKLDENNRKYFEEYKVKAYIGDDPLADFLIPNKLGIITVRVLAGLYRRIPNESVKEEYKPKITIRNLKGLRKVLQSMK
ncbi:MAG: hypothetical protein BXU00_02365 [Candidatus Nanoclepta minutus]|uniref:Haloacid dehalogenase n=1 Tax=Candidatus Nanoclepta minutus TaxID=1940235 RepID=A0A397WP37_9ARCH|nr:MAG: hypothetical protein BXU00_02365 [Candidatus Nanoclepta minutus]